MVTTAYVPKPLSDPPLPSLAPTESNSHTSVILRRWLDPLPTDAEFEWHGPRTQIASLHVMQKSRPDLSTELCRRYGIRDAPSLEDALTLGTGQLAVDAIMLIGEHGDFPHNELQQKLYPRKEMLDEVIAIMERCGRVVPVFFDKHFSWNPTWVREMFHALEDHEIPWFGGSSLSHCPMVPPAPSLAGERIQELVMTTWAELEGYLFHALEVMEAIIENREGGETGIASIVAWEGEAAWAAWDRGEFSPGLLEAAIQPLGHEVLENFRLWAVRRTDPIEIFQLRFCDGLKVTIVRMFGHIRKWAWACRVQGWPGPVASAPMAQGLSPTFFAHFARFARRIEDFFLSGQSPIPKRRLYLTSMACAACMRALSKPGIPVIDPGFFLPEEAASRADLPSLPDIPAN